jgi:hypothetical protein
VANASRNGHAGRERRRRWEPARDALWDFVAPVLDDGARVAIVGAGNGDDLPLRRIAGRAGEVALIDIDPRAARGARRRLSRSGRRIVSIGLPGRTAHCRATYPAHARISRTASERVEVIGHDVTRGTADAIVRKALEDGRQRPDRPPARPGTAEPGGIERGAPEAAGDPLPGAPYDLVVGDLFYSQLLYPALLDLGVDAERRDSILADCAPSLTGAVVARLHASAPRVIHVHDPLAWWDGHEQPVALDQILAVAAGEGADAALALAGRGNGPHESDPRTALAELGLTPAATALWCWPFSRGVDYLACATLISTSGTSSCRDPNPDGGSGPRRSNLLPR